MNLGWKLALVAPGRAPETLLDTDTAERRPIGAWAQRWSMAQTALSQARGARADALREVFTDLLDTPDGATHVVTKISGTWQHYAEGDNPLIGHRVPEQPLAVLIRPHGHVAWVTVGEIDQRDLRPALTTYLGHPAPGT